ncbi:ComEC/Rec2 family competence protein [Clostridium chauvoei]|nr:ComEC/Rec2 family competence protein [Clostridium chauvoei]
MAKLIIRGDAMYLDGIDQEKDHLIYIFLIFILSSVVYEIYSKYNWLAILIASCFFIMIYIYKRGRFLILISLFFTISLLNNICYFNYKPSNTEIIRVVSLNGYGAVGKIEGREVYLEGDLKELKIGERLAVKGKFTKDIKISKGNLGIYKIIDYKKIADDLISKVYKIRENIFYKIRNKLGSRRAALITSISFGYTNFLDEEDRNDMKTLGVTHVIAVSGLHMAIVYSVLMKVFGKSLTPFIAFIYVIFTGASLSTVRAYIMLLCMNLAVPLRRKYNPLAALSLAGVILLIIEPQGVFKIGFQLSFLATLGIILFNKKINKSLYKLPKYIRESLSICISAQIFTFPALLIYFQEFSLGFIIGNLLISPLITIIVILGNLLAIVSFTTEIFNYICFIAYYITDFLDYITESLINILPPITYLNENIALMYMSILISSYFYKKGFKRFIYMPLLFLVYISILIYSPIPKIKYYKEGAILLSYKGDRMLLTLKKDIDLKKIKNISLANKVYKEGKFIKIGDNTYLKSKGKDFQLNNNGKVYLLALSKQKSNSDYDIINFRRGDFDEIMIFSDKVLILD